MRYLTATDRDAIPGILAAVLADPGMTNAEICQRLGHPEYRVRKVLGELRKRGDVGLVRYGPDLPPRWYPPAEAVVIRAKFEAEAADKRREKNREWSRQHNAMAKAGLLDDVDDGLPIRRVGDAHAPLPFQCRAPASVFHIGGML